MMAKVVSVRVEGLSQLGENLRKFSKETSTTVLRKAARSAGNEMRDVARQIAEAKQLRKTGAMIKAIGVRRLSKASSEGKEFVAVGVFKVSKSAKTGKDYKYADTRFNRRKQRVGKNYDVDAPEFYWKFHEFGTVKMRARPFLVPAFEMTKRQSPETMRTEIIAGMARAERKLRKTAKAK
jgi:HK97 gp10 family phage protein